MKNKTKENGLKIVKVNNNQKGEDTKPYYYKPYRTLHNY